MNDKRLSLIACKTDFVSTLVRYIEQNLSCDLDAALLSTVAYSSRAQIYRDFYCMAGHSVKEYIRKRRTSNALALIKTSDVSLSDIAYQCGYSSQQSLCRAVKRAVGLTPLEYKHGTTYFFYPPYSGEPTQSVTVATDALPQTVCLRFYHSSIKDIENKAISTFLKVIPDYNGRIFGRNGKHDGNRPCYELYITDMAQNDSLLVKHGFIIAQTASPFTSLFASSTVPNNEDKINAAWNYLYHTWLQNSMFEYTNEPYYEEYILRGGKPIKLKLYLPIRKRADETVITLVKDPCLYFVLAKAKGYNAETNASKTVINYLTEHYPYIVKTSKEFYLQKRIYSCVSGVAVSSEIRADEHVNVENFVMDKGYYLMLSSNVMGDYDRHVALLLSFARDNGMAADKRKLFAVYDAKESYDNPKVRMYCPVKFETK